MPEAPLDLSRIFTLEPHGPDTYVGESPPYEWGRIYGGLVVGQGLWAAAQTVKPRSAKRRTMALPMASPAPMTRATLPSTGST